MRKGFTAQQPHQPGLVGGQVFGVGELGHRHADQLVDAAADHAREALVDAQQPVARRVGLGHAHAGGVEHRVVAGLAPAGDLFAALQGVDVHQHQHRAVDLLVQRDVRLHAQRHPAPVAGAGLALGRPHLLDDFGDEGLEVGEFDLVPHVADRPADIGFVQVEQPRGVVAETAHPQIAPQHHDDEPGRGLHVHEVAAHPGQFGVAVRHLLVDRGQLFVRRLELFLRGLELLVQALQFLVGRLHFLARCLQFLVCRLVLFLDGLQVFARLGEFGLELGDAVRVGRPALARGAARRLRFGRVAGASGGVVEQHQEAALAKVLERDHLDVDHLPGCLGPDPHAVLAHHMRVFARLRDGRAQRQHQALARHLQQVETRLAHRRREVCRGRPAELQHLQLGIDQHAGRSELVHRDAVGLALGVDLGVKALGGIGLGDAEAQRGRGAAQAAGRDGLAALVHGRQVKGRRGGGLLAVDLVLAVERGEQLGEAADRLGRAQPQEAVWLQRVVKNREHFLLQARLEVDQQVAAGDEVQARERRVADEVLAREHHHFAQRLGDAVAAGLFDEETLQPLGREVLRQGLGVQAVACFLEQRLVQVGRKHLQLACVRRIFGNLHKRHRDRVGLLAGRAAQHPGPHRLFARHRLQRGQHLVLNQVEGLGVAEEAGDADQRVGVQRVQLLGAAVVVSAQRLRVLRRALVLAQHHAARDAALDGARLVEREVDPAVLAQQGEDGPEGIGVRGLGQGRSRHPGGGIGFGARPLGAVVGRAAAARGQGAGVVLVRDGIDVVGFRAGFDRGSGRPARRSGHVRVVRDARQLHRDQRRREYEIDTAGGDGAARHRVVAR